MSFPRQEFTIGEFKNKCDAPINEFGEDTLTQAGKCGGEIKWGVGKLLDGFVQDEGTCEDCGALYTTLPHQLLYK